VTAVAGVGAEPNFFSSRCSLDVHRSFGPSALGARFLVGLFVCRRARPYIVAPLTS